MKNSTVVICGMLRDSEKTIDEIVDRVEEMCKLFSDYRILIVENDSKDSTRRLLLEWSKKNPRVIVLGCGINVKECKLGLMRTEGHDINENRIVKMTRLRNIYLDFIKTHLNTFDYTIVWDMDIVGRVYLDGVANSFGHLSKDKTKKIDMLCANGIYRLGPLSLYYDTYAHRDIDEEFHLSNKSIYDLKKRLLDINYVRGEPLVRVKSCFSGFGIYRTPSILTTSYGTTITKDGHIECEHVVLHKLLNGVYLNPSMIYLVLVNE